MLKYLSTISLCLLAVSCAGDLLQPHSAFADTNKFNSTAKQPKSLLSSPKNYTGTFKQVNDIAQQITVRIEDVNGGNGSGVIVAKQGDIYYVATAAHVVQEIRKVNGRNIARAKIAKAILTPSQERIKLNPADINVANVDLDIAVVKFKSRQNYRVADLGRYSFNKPDWVFISGFPGADRTKQRRLSIGKVQSQTNAEFLVKSRGEYGSLSNGNGLVYTNLSLPGMSGGAVLDRQGRVVGINTGAENETPGDAEIKFGFALGIPIATVLGVGSIPTVSERVTDLPLAQPTQSEAAQIQQIHLSTLPKPSATAKAEAWLDYGNLLWRSQKDRESVAAFKTAIKLLEREPDSGDRNDKVRIAYFGMGLAWFSSDDYSAAVTAFERAVKSEPQPYQSWRYLGLSLTKLQRFDKALTAYKQAIKYQKDDFVLYTELGDVLKELKLYSEAMNAYTAAIALKPTHPWAYTNRGNVYNNLKQFDLALTNYNRAIELAPQSANAYTNRGNVYADLQQFDRAIADYTLSIKIDPQLAMAYNNRGVVYRNTQQFDRAIADYSQAIKFDPQLTNAYVGRGVIYLNQYQYNPALADLETAAQIYRTRNELQSYQQVAKVLNSLKAVMRQHRNPQSADDYNDRAIVYVKQKKYDLALADYTQAIKINPKDAKIYNNRGVVYKDLKQFDRALADFTQAIQFDYRYATAYNNRAAIYAAMKQSDRAIADYTQVIKISPQTATAYVGRGVIYAKQKQYNLALADLETADRLYRDRNDIQSYQQTTKVLQLLKAEMRQQGNPQSTSSK